MKLADLKEIETALNNLDIEAPRAGTQTMKAAVNVPKCKELKAVVM